MDDFEIRNARPGDREAIRDLTLTAFEEYATLMPYWEYYRENIIDTLAHADPGYQIVAEQGGAIVGSVLMYPAGTAFLTAGGTMFTISDPEVRLLAVGPGTRGHGVGAALMNECIRRARRSGARFLTLHTNPIMRAAVRLYERMGFKHSAELDFFVDEEVTVKGYRFDLNDAGR